MGVQSFLKAIDKMDRSEQRRIVDYINSRTKSDKVNEVLNIFRPEEIVCPQCGSVDKNKDGRRAGRQRYRCNDCGRRYNELSNTPFDGLRKSFESIVRFFDLLKEGASLSKIEKECGINRRNAFEWRKKTMKFFQKINDRQTLSGIVEVDETYILHSQKGERNLSRDPRHHGGTSQYRGISRDQDCILTLQDRNGNTYTKHIGQGRPGYDDIKEPMADHIERNSIICTDGMQAYGKFARNHNVRRERVKETDDATYHIQNVNNLHQRFKGWLSNYNGISSKYLDNYASFFAVLKG